MEVFKKVVDQKSPFLKSGDSVMKRAAPIPREIELTPRATSDTVDGSMYLYYPSESAKIKT